MAQRRPSVPNVNMGPTQALTIMWPNAIPASNAFSVSYTGIHAALVLEAQSKNTEPRSNLSFSNKNTMI